MLGIFKKIFCKHNYKLIKKKISFYTTDYIMFDDLGYFDDFLYECTKCGKRKVETKMNEQHPLYEFGRWENIVLKENEYKVEE